MNSINIGIIGCGAFSSSYVRQLCKFPDVRLTAVSSRNISNAQKCAALIRQHRQEQDNEEIAVYTDYNEMLQCASLDAVAVSTPPPAHPKPMIAAAAAGKHVFCEGPMAPNLEQCDAMIAAANSKKIKFTVQYTNRFNKNAFMAKKAVSQGLLGKILMAKLDLLLPGGPGPERNDWRCTYKNSGGGVLFHCGRYAIDTLLWLMGDVNEVYGKMASFREGIEVEDCASATLHFSSGALGQIYLSELAAPGMLPSPFYQIQIIAEKASLTFCPDWSLQSHDEAFARQLTEKLSSETSQPCDGWVSQLRDWIDAIKEDRPPIFPGESFRSQVELAQALYKSAAIDAPVKLPLK